jgi:nicotinate-nucleotide pyrophosphorylase (carboxylating)
MRRVLVQEAIAAIMGDLPSALGAGELRDLEVLIAQSLVEDLGEPGDITSAATIPSDARGKVSVVARAAGVLAGMPVVERVLVPFELTAGWEPHLSDGDLVGPGSVIARITGPMRSLLAMERTALNFLQRLSGIATVTARFVAAVAGTRARIYDTRKTTPAWRSLEKYAVRCGGGCNHRFGLFDAVLIKDNHLAWLEGAARPTEEDAIARAIAATRASTPPGTIVSIEVDSLEQLDRALKCAPDIILVDNLGPNHLAEAVRRRDQTARHVLLEASGGVSLDTVRSLAETGVDRISIGALTHSAPALDLAIDYDQMPPTARHP